MSGKVKKGKISSISGSKAVAISAETGMVTVSLDVPARFWEKLKVNTVVAYVEFNDNTGVILEII